MKTTCKVNPRDPTRALLRSRLTGDMWFALLPLVFILVGGGGMVAMFMKTKENKALSNPLKEGRKKRSRKHEDYNSDSTSEDSRAGGARKRQNRSIHSSDKTIPKNRNIRNGENFPQCWFRHSQSFPRHRFAGSRLPRACSCVVQRPEFVQATKE